MNIQRILAKLSFGISQREGFYNLLANFVADGIPFYEAIEEIDKRWRELKDPRYLITDDILSGVRGKSGRALRLGQAMHAWITPVEAMAIDAGDQAGNLAEGLQMAARLANTAARIRGMIIKELIYPAFLIAIFFLFLFALSTSVIPLFAEVVPRSKWPTSPRMLGMLADWVPLIAGTLITVGIAFTTFYRATKKKWIGTSRDFLDAHIFPWSLSRRISGAMVMLTIAALLRAGIAFSAILDRLGAVSSDWERDHLDRMRNKMRRGVREGDAMAGELFDADVRWEIGIYGRLSDFPQALDKLSTRVIERVINNTQRVFAVIRLLVMILISGMIVWTYGSFLSITMAARGTGGI